MQHAKERRFPIGFTGPRKGMATHQQAALAEELRELLAEHQDADVEAHYRDAVG